MDFLTLDNIQGIAFRGFTSGFGVALTCLVINLLFKFFRKLVTKA